jgi:hypothetical protein
MIYVAADSMLGVPLHPMHHLMTHQLDELEDSVSVDIVAVAVTSQHIIPSSRFAAARYPGSLSQHLMSLIPPKRPPDSGQPSSSPSSQDAETKLEKPSPKEDPPAAANEDQSSGSNTPFSMPTVNFNMKWNWPGYLTLKGLSKNSPKPADIPLPPEEPKPEETASVHTDNAEVDRGALEDAISETISSTMEEGRSAEPESQEEITSLEASRLVGPDPESQSTKKSDESLEQDIELQNEAPEEPAEPPAPPIPKPKLSASVVHLACPSESSDTIQRHIRYYVVGVFTGDLMRLDAEF